MDETQAPVLDPGRGRTKTGWLWAWPATTAPGAEPIRRAWSTSMRPGGGGEHAERFLDGLDGILQVDGYAAYNRLIQGRRAAAACVLLGA